MKFKEKIMFGRGSNKAISAAIAVIIIVVIVVAVVAGAYVLTASTSSSSSSSSSTTSSSSSSSSIVTSATTTCATTGGTGSAWVIGVIEPITGALGSLGKEIYDGADLAASQINATGGITDNCGVKHLIKLQLEDGGPDTTSIALQSAQTLVGQGVQAIVGPCCSADVSTIGSYLLQHKVVMVSSSATAGFITTNYTSTPRYIYRTVPSDNLQTVAIASIILARGFHNVEVVVSNEPYGLGIGNGVKAALSNVSGVTVKLVPYDTGASAYASYPALVQGIANDHPDVIVYAGFIQDEVVLWKDVAVNGQLNNVPTMAVEGEYSTTFFPYGRGNTGPCAGGNCPTNDSTIADYMGNTSMTGTATLSITNTSVYANFVSAYQKAYGISCANGGCLFAPETYDAATLLLKAMAAAKAYNGTAIAEQMVSQSQGYIGASGPKSFNQFGDVSGPYLVWRVMYNSTAKAWQFTTLGDWAPPNDLNCKDCSSGSSTSASSASAMIPITSAVERSSLATSFAAADSW